MLLAGASRIDITPNPGMPMAGYVNRLGKAQGAHDPLYTRALYISSGGDELLILSLDLIRVDSCLYSDLANAIHDATGIPRDRIVIAATHTHSGPEVSTGIWATRKLEQEEVHMVVNYRRELTRSAISAALRAVEKASSAEAYIASAEVTGVAVNRVDPAKPVDHELLSIVLRSGEGWLHATLNLFACHPTVLGPDNLLYSGDLFGYASTELEKSLGATSLMINGAAGNVSTRFSRRAQNYEEVARLGNKIVDAAINAISTSRPLDIGSIDIAKTRLALRSRDFQVEKLIEIEEKIKRELEEAQRKGAPHGVIRFLESNLYGVRIAIERQKRIKALRSIEVELLGIRLGKLVLVAFPGELFNEYQQKLKETISKLSASAAIVGYANGYIGYVPYRTYSTELTYENLVSIVDPVSYPELEAAIVNLATELIR